MTEIIFSFDTEDPVHEEGANGILRSAELLTNAGVVGCYNTVGVLAKALKEWGREDVIDAMKKHEIDVHTNRHTFHPDVNEYTDLSDFHGALSLFLADESECLDTLRETFGVTDFPAAVPPGNNASYLGHYGYAKMGIPVYSGGVVYDSVKGRPLSFCNVYSLQYNISLEKTLFTADEARLREILDELSEREIAILYHHPNRSYFKQYWDAINFNGKNTPKEEWTLSPRHTDEEIDTFFANFKKLVTMIQNDPRFHLTTYRELGERYATERTLKKSDLSAIKAQLDEELFPVTTPDSFCLSDIFLACRDFLRGKTQHECGFVYGFLEEPYAITEPVTVTADEMRESTKWIPTGHFLPDFIYVDDKKLGPADWLRAALEILSGKESVTVEPAHWQIEIEKIPGLGYTYRGTWIHCKSLEDRQLSKRQQLQSWTLRLPKDTDRYIY
ncbi:MAG: hypothetical protein J6Q82_00205 [Clostridia bacterium]|nr:hypothetical protein [Clostridia bacterium]